MRDYERQAWDPGEESEMYVMRNFGKREKIAVPTATEGMAAATACSAI